MSDYQSYNYWLKRCTKSRTGEIKLYSGNTVVRPARGVIDNEGNQVTAITVTHWWTRVIEMFPNGCYRLSINGYWTLTTMSRLREFTPVRLWDRKVHSEDHTEFCPWFDGIVIDQDGEVVNAEYQPNKKFLDCLEQIKLEDDCLDYVGFLVYLLFGVKEDGEYLKVMMGNVTAPRPVRQVDGRIIKIGRDFNKVSLFMQTGKRGGYSQSSIGIHQYNYGNGKTYLKNNTLKRVNKFMKHAGLLREWLPKEWIEYKLTERNRS
jgi:hypothetical protein